jgi:hypothetical protein
MCIRYRTKIQSRYAHIGCAKRVVTCVLGITRHGHRGIGYVNPMHQVIPHDLTLAFQHVKLAV